MTSVCVICDDKLNQTVRKPVCCPYCEFTACRTCCETYIVGLLETTITDIILRFIEHLEQSEPGKWENTIIHLLTFQTPIL